jgi:excisionase family DNA binding protein
MRRDMSDSNKSKIERLLTVRELAAAWAVCERTIRRKIDSNELPAVYVSERRIRVRESDAARYLAAQGATA